MKAIPLIRASQLDPYLTFLEKIGADSDKFLEQSKIRVDVLNTPEKLLSEYQVWDLIERAGKANGSAIEFGLYTGNEGNFDFVLGLMYPSLTAYDALLSDKLFNLYQHKNTLILGKFLTLQESVLEPYKED